MKIVGDRVVPETVAECANMLVRHIARPDSSPDDPPDEYSAIYDQWRASLTDEQWLERNLDLLPADDIRALALAYALQELAAVLRPLVPA